MKKYIAEIDQDELTVRLLERGIKMKRPDGLSGRQAMENIRAQALDGAVPSDIVEDFEAMAVIAIEYFGECAGRLSRVQ